MNNSILGLMEDMEKVERDICNFPLVLAEMLKDEINAADEQEMYKSFKKLIKEYAEDEKGMSAINAFFGAITGGASLEEIITIAIEESQDPTVASGLIVDDSCKIRE